MDEEKKQASLVVDYHAVFHTEKGRKVLYDLMEKNFVLAPTFCDNPTEMAMREGMRNSVLRIMAILKIDPVELTQRIEEVANNDGRYHRDQHI